MIIAFTGRPGSGKTVAMIHMGHKLLKKGYDVHINISMKPYFKKVRGNLYFWHRLSDTYDITKGWILMDEAHIYMRARKWESLPERMELKLAQHRKDGLNMVITTQNLARIDVIVRELVDVHWRMKQYFGRFFIMKEFDPDMDKLMLKPIRTRWFWASKALLNSFDTLAKVDPEKPFLAPK